MSQQDKQNQKNVSFQDPAQEILRSLDVESLVSRGDEESPTRASHGSGNETVDSQKGNQVSVPSDTLQPSSRTKRRISDPNEPPRRQKPRLEESRGEDDEASVAAGPAPELEETNPDSSDGEEGLPRGNRRLTDPNWPIRYPAVALYTIAATSALIASTPATKYVALIKGHKYIITSKADGEFVEVMDENNRQGWAPWAALEVGDMASYDEERFVDTERLHRPPLEITILKDAEEGNVLARTVLGLTDALHEKRNTLTVYNQQLDIGFDTAEKRTRNSQIFYNGVKAVRADPKRDPETAKSLFEILSGLGYNIESFSQLRPVQTTDLSAKIIVYLLIYSDYLEDPGRGPETYAGKSVNAGARLLQHRCFKTHPKSAQSVHYQSARAADEDCMYHICELDFDNHHLAWFCEQMVCLLFETPCRQLRNLPDDAAENRKKEQADALTLLDIAKGVFADTGWPGGCISNSNFGSDRGLNWMNPCQDASYDPLIWMRSDLEGLGSSFRRVSKPLSKSRKLLRIGFWDLIAPVGLIPLGTEVSVVFEFTSDLSRHPMSWAANIPNLCGVTNIRQVLSWAVRVEWSEGSSSKTVWLRRMNTVKIDPEDHSPCAFYEYAVACVVFSFFNQELPDIRPDVSDVAFLAQYDFPIATIHAQKLDFKNHAITVERHESLKLLTSDQSPRLQTEVEIRQRYTEAFAHLSGIQIGGPPPLPGMKCDHCKWARCDCEKVSELAAEGTARNLPCRRCTEYNMLCSWSSLEREDFDRRAHPLGTRNTDAVICEIPDQDIRVYEVD